MHERGTYIGESLDYNVSKCPILINNYRLTFRLFAYFCMQIKEENISIDSYDSDQATPLHFAASKGHIYVVRWLIEQGAAIAPDKYGKTPTDDARENEHTDVSSNDVDDPSISICL